MIVAGKFNNRGGGAAVYPPHERPGICSRIQWCIIGKQGVWAAGPGPAGRLYVVQSPELASF
eukprot:1183090-Alexandrium_andersonii.AAC.1